MKIVLILIVVASSFFLGCSSRDHKKINDKILVIDLFTEPESEKSNLSEIATEVTFIPLETTENSVIRNIRKVTFCRDNIYVQNNVIEILCFDKEGHYKYKLNKTGRGPGEYKLINDFDISSDNRTLLILSGGKIMLFNNTGTDFIFIRSIDFNKPFPSKIDMIPGTNNILLSIDPTTGSEPSLSLLINTDGDTLQLKNNCYKFEKADKENWAMANESLHYNFENSICFKEEFSDTVFFVDKGLDIFHPWLIFDSHGKGFLPRVRYDREYAKSHGNELYWVYSIVETPRYIIYSYEHKMKRNKVLYDKTTNRKFRIALKDALIDDIHGGPAIDPDFYTGGRLYSFVDALALKKQIAGKSFKKANVGDLDKKEDLGKLVATIKETDNPVLIVVTPKN